MRPLADEIRPQTLDDVAGQKHLLGEGALLRRLIENGTDANITLTPTGIIVPASWHLTKTGVRSSRYKTTVMTFMVRH